MWDMIRSIFTLLHPLMVLPSRARGRDPGWADESELLSGWGLSPCFSFQVGLHTHLNAEEERETHLELSELLPSDRVIL